VSTHHDNLIEAARDSIWVAARAARISRCIGADAQLSLLVGQSRLYHVPEHRAAKEISHRIAGNNRQRDGLGNAIASIRYHLHGAGACQGRVPIPWWVDGAVQANTIFPRRSRENWGDVANDYFDLHGSASP